MGMEIEHKFLVSPKINLVGCEKFEAYHGYIHVAEPTVSQMRVVWNVTKHKGRINIKGNRTGASRLEYEYEIPEEEAKKMINELKLPVIHKTRHKKMENGNEWAVDVYHDSNAGLMIAELEIPYEGYVFTKPEWALTDVTECDRYYNRCLLDTPYCEWRGTDKDLILNCLSN